MLLRRPAAKLCAILLSLLAPSTWVAPQAQTADGGETARVIVRFKADSPLLRKTAMSASEQHRVRAEGLGERLGMAGGRLRSGIGLSERTQVMTASGLNSAQLAARMAKEADIEYAVPDERRRVFAAPSDPLYAASAATNPAAGQWYLRAPDSVVKSSINVEPAWDIPGSTIVVADLDTGVRFDHVDLLPVASGGNLLSGYDFVSNDFVGNDGTPGRDSDASDPGDFVTLADVRSSANTIGCTTSDIRNSIWHGTKTAGLIGATTNNGLGMAGVGGANVPGGRTIRVLPVRVLGKCGGFDSDIIAGMRWAAGLSVPDVPANPNPARVLNMSLGGSGACSAAYQQAVNDVTATGAVIVAAAGNSAGHSVGTPANCSGVIAVGGLRHVGTKVGFSDLGPEVAISAPGGNCVNLSGTCLYPILTTVNGGTTTPLAGSSLYTTGDFSVTTGTSFSTPLVAGAAALMLSAQPTLRPDEVRSLLQQTARAFPTTGGDTSTGAVPQCTQPTSADQDECYCTTSTCGAGMLDAGAAVTAAVNLLQARITTSSATATAGQPFTLDASTSLVASSRRIAGYAWSLTNGGGVVNGFTSATNGSTATLTPSAAGSFSVQLTLTDDRGASASTTTTVTVQAATTPITPTTPSGGGSGGGGGGALGLPWLLLLLAAVLALWRSAPAGHEPSSRRA